MQLKQGSGSINFTSEYLQDLIAQAIAKSQELGRSVLLSYSQTWQSTDPLLFLATKSKPQQHRFYWQQPELNLTLAAAGAVAVMSTKAESSLNRFKLAQQFTQQYLADAVVGGQFDGAQSEYISPYVLGGFSFHEGYGSLIEPTWQGFPHVMLFVPSWLLRQTKTVAGEFDCTLNINYCVQPYEPVEKVRQVLENLLIHLKSGDESETSIISSFSSSHERQTLHPHNISSQQGATAIKEIKEIVGELPWTDVVQQVVHLIQRGELEKVVLARALDVIAKDKFDAFKVLNILRSSYPECVSFLFDFGAGTTFLGATPEVLLHFHSQNLDLYLQSNAVAGSTRRGTSVAEDRLMADALLNSAKDLSEHKIVVKFICDRLQALGANLESLEPPKLLKLFNVQHLHTLITACLPNHHWLAAFDVLEQLHPTAAVGGEPKDRAIAFMQQWEVFDRGWYAAPIGWINGNGEGTFAVGIRSGYLEGNKARIFAGAGIVADSQFATELGETSLKFEALLKALNNVNSG